VNNVFSFHVAGSGDNSLTGRQATLPGDDFYTFFQYGGTARAMDSAIDTAAPHETGVSGINNSIRSLAGDISLNNGEFSLINRISKIISHRTHL
jgi:hypothetical protein